MNTFAHAAQNQRQDVPMSVKSAPVAPDAKTFANFQRAQQELSKKSDILKFSTSNDMHLIQQEAERIKQLMQEEEADQATVPSSIMS